MSAHGSSVGDLLDGEIELVARDEIDQRRGVQAACRVDGDFGADQADFQVAVGCLERLDGRDVGRERRRRGVQHDEIVVPRARRHFGELGAVRRRVDQLRAFDQSGRLGEPGRVPERADFAARLIARAGAAVEAVERGGLKKQCPHHVSTSP